MHDDVCMQAAFTYTQIHELYTFNESQLICTATWGPLAKAISDPQRREHAEHRDGASVHRWSH